MQILLLPATNSSPGGRSPYNHAVPETFQEDLSEAHKEPLSPRVLMGCSRNCMPEEESKEVLYKPYKDGNPLGKYHCFC